ncbi:non-ribosomal peptide synthetase [Brevibacillus laterosporus]|uniref:non-ribosomal peptide synthetase n=1 Tax=Brevibacillus laterosporus TaxID=1465 RepID=UPI0018CF8F7A|nr:non-ribosomal peptide synthetase [Brevibacillus laterosporus]MBG9798758.1 gramicidin synthetase [Brevibacillus laterosporus]MCR8936051.1 non-ribosomal peptide synthetase [Brevibacillus laterosporus]MCZ0838690.1 non-ribosomal peptide synthetase [Brevibacillus laterosporus]MCZ0843151.1 non-ribosomal peptide synthetase [Brevibacillus laterosporus]MED1910502.1 non-ribosomal peptide synthetase [Brevibacillus laterosporus]
MSTNFLHNILLASGQFEQERSYWLQQLEGVTDFSGFPFETRPLANKVEDMNSVSYPIPPAIVAIIKRMSNNSDYGIYMFLLAGIKYLLSTYKQHSDIIVGMPVFQQKEDDKQAFSNILPIRSNLDRSLTWKQVLPTLKGTITDAVKNQNLPSKSIAGLLGISNEEKSRPNFGTIVLLDTIHDQASVESITADMVFHFKKHDEGLTLQLDYHPGLYSEESIGQVVNRLFVVLHMITSKTGESLQSMDQLLTHWKGSYTNVSKLQLPVEHSLSNSTPMKWGNKEFTLSHEENKRLTELAKIAGSSLSVALFSVWQLLLHRYTGENDILSGWLRQDEPSKSSSLSIYSDFSGNPSFIELLRRVQRTIDAIIIEQEFSVYQLPAFQILFVTGEIDYPSWTDDTELALTISQRETGLVGTIFFDTERFREDTIQRLIQHLTTMLKDIMVHPDISIGQISLLDDSERDLLLTTWNDTNTPFPSESLVQELFEEQVRQYPDQIAIIDGEIELTYRELHEKSNQMAHRLQRLGVQPDTLVGISMERSPEMIIGILAILKAGAAYLPIDLTYPEERISFIIKDSQLTVLITKESHYQQFADYNMTVVLIDSDFQGFDQESLSTPSSNATATNMAYVIYTSGSTGTPKGTRITHQSINRLVKNNSYVDWESTDRLAQVSNTSFDAFTFELWGTLLHGATLVLIAPDVVLSPYAFQKEIHHYGITMMLVTTALFNQYAGEKPELFTNITVLFGGEAADPKWVRVALEKGKPKKLINVYGPAECTVFTTTHHVTQVAADALSIPIGKPIANTQVYVLDQYLQVVPIGVPGELYVGGPGLALGYLHRLEITSERFIKNIFSSNETDRLYKTGDIVRYLPDGTLSYIGREDDQVKIRGFRIELGEIEAVLGQHPEIRDAVVMMREDQNSNKQLIAYFTAYKPGVVTTSELRSFAEKKIPMHMIPATFIYLDHLPVTPNGKVDRKALPAPFLEREEGNTPFIEPVTDTEIILSEFWKEILGIGRISIIDDFFNSGGHSLLATQLLSRIYHAFHIEISLRTFFENPTIQAMGKQIDHIISSGEQSVSVPLVPVSRDDDLVLSYTQQGVWFIEQLEPGSATYNVPVANTLKGSLNIDALERAVNEIIRRHEILRTSFISKDGKPYQLSHPFQSIRIPLIEMSDVPAPERHQRIIDMANEDANRSFDLTKCPLVRFILFKKDEESYVFYYTMHHLIMDGWSLQIFTHELSVLYEAFSQGKPSPLPEMQLQYADFAAWQRKWLDGKVMNQQLAYWKKQLAGNLPVLQLPIDRTRPSVASGAGQRDTLVMPKELVNKLHVLCKRQGVTLYMALLSAFKVLLSRYSGETDILVGSPIANRTRLETEGMIGFFANTIVLRSQLSDNPTFTELLKQVREGTLEAFSNQDVPFEKLVEVLQPERTKNITPIFQVMFTLQNTRRTDFKLSDETLIHPEIDRGTSMFDLLFDIAEHPDGLLLVAEYNMDIFFSATIGRMMEHYRELLESIVELPEQPISDLNMLTKQEKIQILEDFNDTKCDFPLDKTTHELFEKQVECRPTDIAVIHRDQQMTYEELNARANQMARFIRRTGMKNEEIIAVFLERSIPMMESILGIWKAGGAYIPIDTAYPIQRIIGILEDSGAAVLITTSKFVTPEIIQNYRGTIICIDDQMDAINQERKGNLSVIVEPDHLAYIIYTSGSTGKPKGAMVEHIGLNNHLHMMIKQLKLSEDCRIAQTASHCFDISVWQFFTSIILGGTTIIYDNQMTMEPTSCIEQIIKDRINIFQVVPSVLSVMLDHVEETKLSLECFRYVSVTGEAIKRSLVARWFKLFPHIPLANAYGPSEASDDVTIHILDQLPQSEIVPIGKPLHNFKIYIVDEKMNLCPVGIKGEICVSGLGVGRGYLNDPERTAKVFMEDPFADHKGVRLYKTGDMGRWLSDGTLEFFGRKDYQVKIRGFRIELEEIENQINNHPDISETVVMDIEDTRGQKSLCAYVVLKQDVPINQLKSHLANTLPDYMIPAFFVKMERLPLTTNGKVDRKALPKPDRNVVESKYVAPRTIIEEKIIAIWESVLDTSGIGIEDHFFENGGHSLKATTVISRINKELQVDISLREIFNSPIIKDLAQVVENSAKKAYPMIQPVKKQEAYQLSSAQKRMFIVNLRDSENIAYNIPNMFIIEGKLDKQRLHQALQKLVERHEILRTSFGWEKGEPVQYVQDKLELDLKEVTSTHEQLHSVVQSLVAPFDLGKAPLLRLFVVTVEEGYHVLVLDMHHIIMDGSSIAILLDELVQFYQEKQLPEPRIQYKDFSAWQNKLLMSEIMQSQEKYWLDQFTGQLPVLALPTDYPRPSVKSFEGNYVEFCASKELTLGLRNLASSTGTTLYMVLLAAYHVLLTKYARQQDIIIGTPIAGRHHADLEKVIGMFVNTLAIRLQSETQQTFSEFLLVVKEHVLQAFDNQDYQFDMLVEKLDAANDESRNPLFDTMFILQNIEEPYITEGNDVTDKLSISRFDYKYRMSKFDLSVITIEADEELVFQFEYANTLFSNSTINILGESFLKLLTIIVTETDKKLCDLEITESIDLIEMDISDQLNFHF